MRVAIQRSSGLLSDLPLPNSTDPGEASSSRVIGRILASGGGRPLLCGTAEVALRLKADIDWRNRHGRYVSRTAVVRGSSLFVCKFSANVEAAATTLEVPLRRGTTVVHRSTTHLRLRAPSGPPVEIRLSSKAEADRCLL